MSEETKQGCGCGDATDCCSPGSGSPLKIVLFLLVLVIAAGVAAHSIITGKNKNEVVDDDATVGVIATELVTLRGEADVVFAILPANAEQDIESVEEAVTAAATTLEELGKNVSTAVVGPDHAAREALIQGCDPETFPAVVVVGKATLCKIRDDITQDELLTGYLLASSDCSGTVCGPDGCGLE